MESETGMTDDVKRLIGDPKKAILATAVPIALSSLVQSANNMIDAVWVAGLGTAALAATAIVFPFFFMMIGLGNGIGVGASQAIARRIGAKDYEGTHKAAAQALFMTLAAALVFGTFLLLAAHPLMDLASAGDYMDECLAYAYPIFFGTLSVMISCLMTALLRAEGAAKRSMHMSLLGAGLNMMLDPLFIYVFDWGIAGAAWATVIAITAADVLGLYWYFGRKDTFVRIPVKGFRFDPAMDRDILKVGIPASLEIVLMSLTGIIMNAIIAGVDPVDGIAVYGTGWRAINLLTIPAMAMGFALVPVVAAARGAGNTPKMREGYMYSMRFGFCSMLAIAALTFIGAPLIVSLFTYSNPGLAPAMTEFLRIAAVFMPAMALSFPTASFFQGLGMGVKSLLCSLSMNLMRIPFCAFAATTGVLTAVWWGLTAAEILAAVFTLAWGLLLMRVLMREWSSRSSA